LILYPHQIAVFLCHNQPHDDLGSLRSFPLAAHAIKSNPTVSIKWLTKQPVFLLDFVG